MTTEEIINAKNTINPFLNKACSSCSLRT